MLTEEDVLSQAHEDGGNDGEAAADTGQGYSTRCFYVTWGVRCKHDAATKQEFCAEHLRGGDSRVTGGARRNVDASGSAVGRRGVESEPKVGADPAPRKRSRKGETPADSRDPVPVEEEAETSASADPKGGAHRAEHIEEADRGS